MEVVVYSITDWSDHFEVNRTKELKTMSWVPIPNKQDGDGYTELLDHPNGAAHFGAWVALIQVASKCDPRGTLLRDGRGGVRRPHDAASLGRITRIPASVFVEALPRLLLIGWLTATPCSIKDLPLMPHDSAAEPQVGAAIPQDGAPSRAGATGQNSTEHGTEEQHNVTCSATAAEPPSTEPPALLLAFPCVGVPNSWNLDSGQVKEWGQLYPDMDILGESRKALAWVMADTKRRKTAGGMRKFLVGWFSKAADRGQYQRGSPGGRPGVPGTRSLGSDVARDERLSEVGELWEVQ